MTSHQFRPLCTFFAALVVFAALAIVRAQAAPILHVAIVDGDGFQTYIARDTGMFQRAGLDVEIENLGKGSAVAAAVAGHGVEIGISNVVTIAQGVEHGLPFRFISPATMSYANITTTQIVTWPDSNIHSAKDLNGKTLGAQTTSGITRLAEDAWIDKNGGDSSTVTFIELPPQAILPALERGTIAAATLFEPMLTADRSQVRGIGNPFPAISSKFMVTGWFATTDWIAQNPQLTETFAKVMTQAARWALDPKNKAQVGALYQKYGGSSTVTPLSLTFDPGMLQPMLDAALKYKLLTRPIAASELILKK